MSHLLELFCGTKSVGKVFEGAGWRVTSVDADPAAEPTILCDAAELRPEQIQGPVDLVWASPPCTQYSRARTTAKTPRDLEGSDRLVKVGIDLARHFGSPLFMENPQSMLQHREVVKDLRMCLVDYCKYADDRWPKFYRKRTMIFCLNHDWMPQRPLCRKDCQGSDGKAHREYAQRAPIRGRPGNQLRELYAIPPALPEEILRWWDKTNSVPSHPYG